MITKEQAIQIVINYVTKNGTYLRDNPPYIVKSRITELPYGWLFFWGSKKFQETGDVKWAYIGNSPLLVDKYDGTTQGIVASMLSIEEQLNNYANEKGYNVDGLIIDEEE